jgi:hypothetical protein
MKRKIFLLLIILCLCVSGCKKHYINEATQSSNATVIKSITQQDAFTKVKNIVGNPGKGYHLDFDHMQMVNNKQYYVMHLYEIVIDDKETGDSHTATYGWYYVDKETGDVYQLNLPSNNLVKIS